MDRLLHIFLTWLPTLYGQSEHSGPGLLPAWEDILRVMSLRDYNTRIVMFGVMCLGLAAGVVGVFMLLRKRSLMGDAISHATLPGICLAFMIMVAAGGSGKFLPGLLAGAFVTGQVLVIDGGVTIAPSYG